MNRPRLICKPSAKATRLLLTHNDRELLRAVLPSPLLLQGPAAPLLCEALARWLRHPLHIALYADIQGTSSALALCDGMGHGDHGPHYQVQVLEPVPRQRLSPLGSFGELRKLDLAVRGEK
jgi:hypothetical protein